MLLALYHLVLALLIPLLFLIQDKEQDFLHYHLVISFFGTLIDTSNNLEIVKVTARSSDSMTVVRAQDNTTARAFAIGDRFELRPTAALFNAIKDEASLADGDYGDITVSGSKLLLLLIIMLFLMPRLQVRYQRPNLQLGLYHMLSFQQEL